jgi:hypothetical protein
MAKVARNARKSRKVNVSPVNVAPAMLQIAFHATEPEVTQHESASLENNEILVIDAPEQTDENDVFAMYEVALEQSFNARVERDKSDSVAAQIREHYKCFRNERVARLMYEARVMPDFPVKSRRTDAFFNVKAIDRITDVLRFVLRAQRVNEHVRIIFSTLYNYDKSGLEFSGSALDWIYNKSASLPAHLQDKVVRPAIIYTSGTRSAQQSMTLNALITLNVITAQASRDSRVPAFTLNHDNVITQKLIEELQLA